MALMDDLRWMVSAEGSEARETSLCIVPASPL
jgi:hypothetical protein